MKLLLVDDHPLFLEGLQYLLEAHGIEVVGVAGNGKEALAQARLLQPDVILMDIKMPVCNGVDALKLIKTEMPEIKIIMLTTSDDDDDLFDAVKYGASGYLLKNIDAKRLMDMLSDLENGETILSQNLAKKLLREFRCNKACEIKLLSHASKDSSQDVSIVKLTERQLEVLEMAAKGETYKEMGDALGLTERTVKYHMGRIVELLHLENRAQVIAYAARIGLVKDK